MTPFEIILLVGSGLTILGIWVIAILLERIHGKLAALLAIANEQRQDRR